VTRTAPHLLGAARPVNLDLPPEATEKRKGSNQSEGGGAGQHTNFYAGGEIRTKIPGGRESRGGSRFNNIDLKYTKMACESIWWERKKTRRKELFSSDTT